MSWKTDRYPTNDEVVEYVVKKRAVTVSDVARLAQSGPTPAARDWASRKLRALEIAGRISSRQHETDTRKKVYVPCALESSGNQ